AVAAVLAAAGCGSVAAPSGNASPASPGSGPGSPGSGSASGSSSAGASPGQDNGTSGPLQLSQILCGAPGSASQVVITKAANGPVLPTGPRVAAAVQTSPEPPAFPPQRPLVKGAAQASALAKAICGLPGMPAGVLRCPQRTPVIYRLTFTVDGRLLPVVTVQPSGCETVAGAGIVRTASTRPAFWKLLASMVGPVPLPGAVHLPGTS
ncbi:MAG: hypothetical protein ACRDNZ_23865, partial [Streptosporangiaceae bacterium]